MDRLRRSLRQSFRRGSAENRGQIAKPDAWNEDDLSVRAGTCSFAVKYLGYIEVYESRGMQICEDAMKLLRSTRHRSTRGILYISGDGLRVVDADSKGLIVDQTIEKVSFCAPDRNHEKGFAYICREGTTRRWLCHGFHAIRDSGERLSHAVGCAFAVCLERKQKRDREVQLIASQTSSVPVVNGTSSVNHKGAVPVAGTPFDNSGSGAFKRGSFRHLSLRDRLCDPQHAIPAEPPPVKAMEYPHAIARPHANRALLKRQGSLRLSANESDLLGTFRRFNSLRISNISSGCVSRPFQLSGTETIVEEEGLHDAAVEPRNVSPLASAASSSANDSLQDACSNEFNLHTFSSSTSQPNFSSYPSPPKGTGKGEQWLQSLALRARTARVLSEDANEVCGPPNAISPLDFEVNEESHFPQQALERSTGDPSCTTEPVLCIRRHFQLSGSAIESLTANVMDPFEARWNALNPHRHDTNPFVSSHAAATEATQ
uniref:PID domain-containing protein n=1 Tax=Trichuris muris TaxID=70415 RepID=A0A5S6QVP4_TRIMR